MTKPNTSRFLAGALNPPARSKLRKRDRKALEEVFEDENVTSEARAPRVWEKEPFVHDPDREHWSKVLGEPLDEKALEAVATQLEVWVLDGAGKTKLLSVHRVSPKKYFGLTYSQFPSEDQRIFCEEETKRIAQRVGWDCLLNGARRVDIRSYRRKGASSRFHAGPAIHDWVATMKSLNEEPWILGEPTERAIEIDRGYGI